MKRFLATLFLCMALIGLPGCGDPGAVYDDDAKLADTGNSNSMVGLVSSRVGNGLSAKVSSFKGSRTIWTCEADDGDELSVAYSLSVESGRAKLVLITPDDEVVVLVECADDVLSVQAQAQTISLQPGLNRIKIVCDDAKSVVLTFATDIGMVEW